MYIVVRLKSSSIVSPSILSLNLEQLSLREQRTLVLRALHSEAHVKSYYGPNCGTFCAPIEDVYTCGSEGSAICVHGGLNPVTNCTECLVPGYDPSTYCTVCLPNTQCQPILSSITTSSKINIHSMLTTVILCVYYFSYPAHTRQTLQNSNIYDIYLGKEFNL